MRRGGDLIARSAPYLCPPCSLRGFQRKKTTAGRQAAFLPFTVAAVRNRNAREGRNLNKGERKGSAQHKDDERVRKGAAAAAAAEIPHPPDTTTWRRRSVHLTAGRQCRWRQIADPLMAGAIGARALILSLRSDGRAVATSTRDQEAVRHPTRGGRPHRDLEASALLVARRGAWLAAPAREGDCYVQYFG